MSNQWLGYWAFYGFAMVFVLVVGNTWNVSLELVSPSSHEGSTQKMHQEDPLKKRTSVAIFQL
jgi:hypothetical protein